MNGSNIKNLGSEKLDTSGESQNVDSNSTFVTGNILVQGAKQNPKKSILKKTSGAVLNAKPPTLTLNTAPRKESDNDNVNSSAAPQLQRTPSIGSGFSITSWISRLPSSAQLLIGSAVDHIRRGNVNNSTPFIDEEDMHLSDEDVTAAQSAKAGLLPPSISSSSQSSRVASPVLGHSNPPLLKNNTTATSAPMSPNVNTYVHVLSGGWFSNPTDTLNHRRTVKRVRFNFSDEVKLLQEMGEEAPLRPSLPDKDVQELAPDGASTNCADDDLKQVAEKQATQLASAENTTADDEEEILIDHNLVRISQENLHWTPDGKDKHPRIMYSTSNEQINSLDSSAESATSATNSNATSQDLKLNLSESTAKSAEDKSKALPYEEGTESSESDEDDLNPVLEAFLFDPNDMPDNWGDLELLAANGDSSGEKSTDNTDDLNGASKGISEEDLSDSETNLECKTASNFYTIEEVYQIYIRDLEKRGDKGLQSVIDSMNAAFRHKTNLGFLNLKGDPINRKSINSICDLLKMHSGLNTLILEDCSLDDSFLKLVLDSILLEDTVQTLSIARNSKIKTAGAKYIAIYMRKSKSLRSLDLSCIPLDGKGIAYIGHGLYEEIVRQVPAQNEVHIIQLLSQVRVLRMNGISLRRHTSAAFSMGGNGSSSTFKTSGNNRIGWDALFKRIPKSNLQYFSITSCRLREVIGTWGPELLRAVLPSGESPVSPKLNASNSSSGKGSQDPNMMLQESKIGEASGRNTVSLLELASEPAELAQVGTALSDIDKPLLWDRDESKSQTLESSTEVERTKIVHSEHGSSYAVNVNTDEHVELSKKRIGGLLGLNLSWNPLGSHELVFVSLAQALALNCKLRFLILEGCMIGDLSETAAVDKGFTALVEALKLNSTLEYLDLTSNKLTNCFGLVTDLISCNCGIKNLRLSNAELSSENIIALAECLPLNSTLQKLDLKKNRGALDVAALMALNASLKFNKTIISLELDSVDDTESIGGTKTEEASSDATQTQVIPLFLQEIESITTKNLASLSAIEKTNALEMLRHHTDIAVNPGVLVDGSTAADVANRSGKSSKIINETSNSSTPLLLFSNKAGASPNNMLQIQSQPTLTISDMDLNQSSTRASSSQVASVSSSVGDLVRLNSATQKSKDEVSTTQSGPTNTETDRGTDTIVGKSESLVDQKGVKVTGEETISNTDSLASKLREIYQVPVTPAETEETKSSNTTVVLSSFQVDPLQVEATQAPILLTRRTSSNLSSPISFAESETSTPISAAEITPRQIKPLPRMSESLLAEKLQEIQAASQSTSLQVSEILDPLLEHFSIDDT